MAGPSPWNIKAKAKNRRKAKKTGKTIGQVLSPGSSGGRTPSEAGLARSMAASGKKVSRSNRRTSAPTYRPKAPSAVESVAESKRRGRQTQENTLRDRFERLAGVDKAEKAERRSNRRVRNTRREADSRMKSGNRLRPTINAYGQVSLTPIRQESNQEFRRDQKRYNKARIDRRNQSKQRTNNRIKRTAVDAAVAISADPKSRKKNQAMIEKSLRSQKGRARLAGLVLEGEAEAVAEEQAPNRFTGTTNPYRRSSNLTKQAEQQAEALRRNRQQLKVVERQYRQQVRRGNAQEAQAAARQYRKQVNEINRRNKQIQQLQRKADRENRKVTNEVAAGKWDGIINLTDDKKAVELPSLTKQKDELRQGIEEGFGLGLSPADFGMAVATGFVGKTLVGGTRAALVGTKAARVADDNLKLVPAVVQGLRSTNSYTGRITAAGLNLLTGRSGQIIRRGTYGLTAAGAIAGREYAVPFVAGAADAAFTRPVETGQTTFRNVMGSVAALPTLGANIALTVKRAGAAPFVEADYKRQVDYITAPVTQLAESAWEELETMFRVYTSKDAAAISRATAEDYGAGPVFSAYFLLRPFTRGLRIGLGKTGNLVSLPAFGTTNTFADRIVGVPGTQVKGIRGTLTPVRQQLYDTTEKAVEAGNKIIEQMPEFLTNALPHTIGFRNPFTEPDARRMIGRETLSEIGQRRAATARVFLAKNRADAMVSTMMAQATTPVREVVQWYNARSTRPAWRSAHSALEKRLASYQDDIELGRMESGVYGQAPKPVTLADLVNEIVTRGLHQNREGVIGFDYANIKALADAQPPGSVAAQRLNMFLGLPRVFDPTSVERRIVETLAQGIDHSHSILREFRRQGILEQYGEGTPEARAKLESDANAVALETALAYERITGKPAPARPEVALEELLDEYRKVIDDEEADVATKRKNLDRISKQARDAVRALYNRDLQDRARIRSTGVRGRLTEARRELARTGIKTRVNEATEWLIHSGGYRQALTQRLREINGALQSLDAKARQRAVRQGELKQREKEERRRAQAGQEELPDTRALAERVMRDRIDEEAADAEMKAALRAEKRELEKQSEELAAHDRAMRLDRAAYVRAEKKVEGILDELESRVNESLRTKVEDLTDQEQRFREEVITQQMGLQEFRRDVRGKLTKQELEAIERRVDEEIVERYGPNLSPIDQKDALVVMREHRNRRVERITRELDSHKRLSNEEMWRIADRYEEILSELNDVRTELALILTALREGKSLELVEARKVDPYDAIDRELGTKTTDQIVEFEDGTKVIAELRVEGDEIRGTNIVALPEGTGAGSKVMGALEKYADETGRKLILEGVTADEYFAKRGYVVKGESSLLPGRMDYERKPQATTTRQGEAAEGFDEAQRQAAGADRDAEGAAALLRDEIEQIKQQYDAITSDPEAMARVREEFGGKDEFEKQYRGAIEKLEKDLADLEKAARGPKARPSGKPYEPGTAGAPPIAGRSQVVNDLIKRYENLTQEQELIKLRLANHDSDLPPQTRRQMENKRADDISELSVIDDKIRRQTLLAVPAASTAKVKKARMRSAVGVAVEEKKRAALEEDMRARQALWDQFIEEAYEFGLGQAHYVAHTEFDSGDLSVSVTGPSVDSGLRMPYEKQRTGSMERAGNVARGIDTLIRDAQTLATRQARQRTSQALMSQAFREEGPDGTQKTEFTQEEAGLLAAEGAFDPTKFTWVPTSMLHDDQFNGMIDALVRGGATRGDIDAYVKSQLPELTADEVRLSDGETRLTEKFLREGGGVRGVLVPNQSIKIVIDSERKLEGADKVLYAINKASSRLVLGTSVSWMIAQPIAETLILVMDQANPARLLRAAKTVNNLRKTPEGRRTLTLLSGSSYGAARDLRASTRIQQDYQRSLKVLDQMPIITLAEQAARLELLGSVDQWKGAWIREIGAVAELEREQSNLRRAGKAFLDQKDAIEKAASKLATMTPEEQVLWTGTAEGAAVANQIARNIDAMLGNWTDVKPGAETTLGSLVFFYPFVRFSMKWTFATYPKRHPVRAALAQIYGAINAEMLEEWLDFDPAWVSDWAAAPIFGNMEDADGDGEPDRISSLMGLNRISPSGNAFIEYGALSDNPFFTLTKVSNPMLGILGRAMYGRDPYGQPLVNPGSTFGITELPGAGTIAKQVLDEGANLIAPLRSIIRYTGFRPSEVLTKGDAPWDLLGEWPGVTTDGPGLLTASSEQSDRYQGQVELAAPGDDQNLVRDFLRRELLAVIPKPAHYYRTEQKVNALFDRRTASQKDSDYPYPDVMYRGRLMSLYEASEKIRDERKAAIEGRESGDGMTGTWQPTSQQKNYLRRADKIAEVRDNGRRVKELTEQAIVNTYQEAGLTLGTQNKIRRSVLDRARQEGDTLRKEWEEKIGGEYWAPKQYPGDKQAQIDLNRIKDIDDAEDGMSRVAGPVNTVGTFVAEGQATPRRKQLVEKLRQGSRARIEAAGGRRVDLTDPTLDPSTVTRKTDEGTYVVRYRGKKVLGQMTVADLRRAEKNNTLDVNEDGRLTIPETRRAVARVEQAGVTLVAQQKKIARLQRKAGGVPSGVPKKYRASVRKWGAWLESEMKKNGLVQPYETAIMDGYGVLPQGMSGAEFLSKILQAESGWDETIGSKDNTSSVGAMGLGQFMPSTRASVLDNYGVDAYGDADQQIQAAAILLSKGGMENYNSLFPNSSDDPVKRGGYHYYYEQDVGKMVVTNKAAAQKIRAAQSQLDNLQKQFEGVAEQARGMGVPVQAIDQSVNEPVNYPAKQAKQLNGAWGGTERLLDMANGGDFEISSTKRTPDQNAAVGGSSTSDHLTTNPLSFAHDLPTTDVEYGNKIIQQYYNRLKLNEPIQFTGTHTYTSRKYPGYAIQIIWQDDGHYDHVHVGMRYTGDDLPAGTFYGSGGGVSAPSSGGAVSGGGGALAAGGGGGGGGLGPGVTSDQWSIAESQSDIEPLYAAEQIAELGEAENGQVESIGQAIANLPSVKARKKKSLRFDPNTRI